MNDNVSFSLNPKQLFSFLSFAFSNNLTPLIKGKPGIGKTAIVLSVASKLNLKTIVLHPVTSEPVDFKGFPFVVNGCAEFLPYGDLRAILEATEPTLVFFDDLGQADISVQKALMQIIHSRSINGNKIPDCVRFCAATNRINDMAGVSSIIEPLKSRFHSIIELDVTSKDWAEWAVENNMPFEVIQFVRYRNNILDEPFKPTRDIENSPCPRTLEAVCKMIINKIPQEFYIPAFSGAIGKGYAVELYKFIQLFSQLPNITQLLKNPNKFVVPKEIDVLYATCGALVSYCTPELFGNLYKILEILGDDNIAFQVMIVKDLQMKFGSEFIMHPDTVKFAEKNYKWFL